MENDKENVKKKYYTLDEEALKKLLTQTYRNGVIGAYQTLYDAIEIHVTDDKFANNKDMIEGFNFCKSLIYTMMETANQTLPKSDI